MAAAVKKGLIFVISAPSGAGKSTLAKAIMGRDKRFMHPVSYTTRAPRPLEKDGRDYHFRSLEEFDKLWDSNELLERAYVHDAHYGTSKKAIDGALRAGKYILLAIDIKGARAITEHYPNEAIRIFLLPPNKKAWIARLKKRKESDLSKRMANAQAELKELPHYDYVLVNDDLKTALQDFFAIVRAEELRRLKNNMKGWINSPAPVPAYI